MIKRYWCTYFGKRTLEKLNENIKRYDIYIQGIYECTCYVKPKQGRAEAIERFKHLKKGYANMPNEQIETRLICII